jgi:hypothetical protein
VKQPFFLCVLFVVAFLSSAKAEGSFCTSSKFVMPGTGQCVPDKFKCEGAKQVVGKCFDVRGRLWIRTGDRMELWSITTDVLNMEYSEGDPNIGFPQTHQADGYGRDHLPLPARVANLLDEATTVYGDFRACPMKPWVKGLHTVCIERGAALETVVDCPSCDKRTPLSLSAFEHLYAGKCIVELGSEKAADFEARYSRAFRPSTECSLTSMTCNQVAQCVKDKCAWLTKWSPDKVPRFCMEDNPLQPRFLE